MKPRNLRGVSYLALAVAAVLTSGAVQAQQTTALPSAREIVDRAVREAGGQTTLKAIKSIRAKGTIELPAQGVKGEIEVWSARPSKLITRATVPGFGKIEEGFDGKIGWTIDPSTGPSLVTGKALLERGDEAWFDAPLHTPDFVKEMTVAGRETFDKRPAYRLKIKLASGIEQEELFDVETGLQIGIDSGRR
jgi:outer membrane lipoprotein-sorting protein